jgi:hypothetical protein
MTPLFMQCKAEYGNFLIKIDLRMGTITKLTPLFTKCNIQYGNFGLKTNLRVGTGHVLGPPVPARLGITFIFLPH